MKVVSSIGSLKNRSKDCQIVKRRGRLYVICKSDPRLKVRQGRAKMKRRVSSSLKHKIIIRRTFKWHV